MRDVIKLGDHIRAKRVEKGLRQGEVSVVTGLSAQYISDIECNRYTPSVEALTKLAKYLDLDLNACLK